MKITSILVVDEVEKSLPFWVERMGFGQVVAVPDNHPLDFVILARGGSELMLQTVESVRKDEPKFAPAGSAQLSSLFIEVDDFADTLRRLDGYPITMPDRTTFYGMREIGVYEPAGHVVIFATRV